MIRRGLTCLLLTAMVVVGSMSVSSPAHAGGMRQAQPRYDLFYNYYVGPSMYGGQPAQLYLSPRPTPSFVGETFITYQPLMPHEFLYKHHRCYKRYNFYDCGATTTRVCWW